MPTIQYRSMNENGRYIGESHPKAKLSNADVDRMREMHEDANVSERCIARRFGVSRRTVRDILSYKNRAQTITRVVKYVRPE